MPVITEEITIEVREDCPNNPIMLRWLNSLAGWSDWLFHYNQIETYTVDKGQVVEQTIFDIETAEIMYKQLGNTEKKNLAVGATDLTLNQWLAIKEINSSPQVYQVFQDGTKIGLISVSTTTTRRTKNNRYEIELEVQYPDILSQKG